MKFRVLIILFFIAFKAFPQNSLSGKITDQTTSEPLTGATIYLPDLKKGASTNENGIYQLDNLPKGKFLAQVHFIGYSSITKTLEINGPTIYDFILSQSATELKAV